MNLVIYFYRGTIKISVIILPIVIDKSCKRQGNIEFYFILVFCFILNIVIIHNIKS